MLRIAKRFRISVRRSSGTASRVQIFGGLLGFIVCGSTLAWSASPASIFVQAMRQDDEGHAYRAFLLYLRAAEGGLPDAEFNVAVMLDSGRGVTANVGQAAIWYARAASHGNRRAAYNLGQLYEAGEGVPKNDDIARAWFAASRLPAARARLAALGVRASRGTIKPPTLVAPAAGVKADPRLGGIEFVWTSQPQSEPVRYDIDLHALSATGSRQVFAASVETSSLFATPRSLDGSYEWRVVAVGRKTGRTTASEWSRFDVARN